MNVSDRPFSLNCIDLFSGAGGITLGFSFPGELSARFSVNPRLMVDHDPEVKPVVFHNFPRIPFLCGDLHNLSGTELRRAAGMGPKEELHILTGGPPCQGFSGLSGKPLNDPRNLLVADYLRLVKELSPRVVVMENVPQIITSHGEVIIKEVIGTLNALGYHCVADILVASDYGVPQLRKRAIVIAYHSSLHVLPGMPIGTHERVESAALTVKNGNRPRFDPTKLPYIGVEEAIGDLPVIGAGGGEEMLLYQAPPTTAYQKWAREGSIAVFNHRARAHKQELDKKIRLINEGGRNTELPDELRFSDNYFSQAYARLHRNGIAQTITTMFGNPGSGRFTHYREQRSITVREAARIQSFPDRFILEGHHSAQMRHVGNAVPPLMAKAIRDRIFFDLQEAFVDKPRPRGRPKKAETEEVSTERSRIMSLVKSANTRPELKLRKALWASGLRGFRTHSRKVPGNPDIVFPSSKLAIFVDGGFWHGHPDAKMPKTNREYWEKKIARNKQRDQRVNDECTRLGWTVLRFWDFDIDKDSSACVKAVKAAMR